VSASLPAPPEGITDLNAEVMFSDPFPHYADLRRTAPVSRVRSKQLVGANGYMLTRYDDVLFLHTDPRFSSDPTRDGSKGWMKHMPRMFRLLTDSMVYKDDPDHGRLRRLVSKAFTPRRVQDMSAQIEDIVDQLVAKLGDRRDVDLVSEFTVPLPLEVISRMLGVDEASRTQFHVLMERFASGLGSGSALEAILSIPTARKLLRVIEGLADARRTSPDDALISALLAASEDGDQLNPDEVVAMIFLLMLAGHDTTANLIGSSMLALIEHPDQAARLRDDPSVAPSAVEELLRFTTPVPCGAARTTLADVEVAGTTIPRGSKVLGMIISANRDESVFDDPDMLDLGRDPNRHLTFAFGRHFCLGNQLARLEGQMAISALVKRFPDMQLAVPKDQLRYKPVHALRGLRSLPVRLS
jgi:cytochrome P450